MKKIVFTLSVIVLTAVITTVTITGWKKSQSVLYEMFAKVKNNDFEEKMFIPYKGGSMIAMVSSYNGMLLNSITFRSNGTGVANVTVYREAREVEFNWEYDAERNWAVTTSLDGTTHTFFSIEKNVIKMENTDSYYAKNEWIDASELIKTNMEIPEHAPVGRLKSNGVNLRSGPGMDYHDQNFSDASEIDFHVLGQKGDWLKIAYTTEHSGENMSMIYWVYSDLFIVNQGGQIAQL